jgi:hypothetical protein
LPLTNTQLLWYDSNVLRLTQQKRTEYHEQVDRLIRELRKHVENREELKVTKVVKAGSFAKYTILRKTNDDAVDVDVVFYITGKDASHETFKQLSDTIYELLIKIYPTKKVEDFEIQRRAATVTFIGTGLAVDIVPLIQDPTRPDYGWQFDIQDGSKSERRARPAPSSSSPTAKTPTRISGRWCGWASAEEPPQACRPEVLPH